MESLLHRALTLKPRLQAPAAKRRKKCDNHEKNAASVSHAYLERILCGMAEFSADFYTLLVTYLEWGGPLLCACKVFHEHAREANYVKVMWPSVIMMNSSQFHNVMSRNAAMKEYSCVKHLRVLEDQEQPALVRPAQVCSPLFPSVTRFELSYMTFQPERKESTVVWRHIPNLTHFECTNSQGLQQVDVKGLRACRRLAHIDFERTDVTDKVLETLANETEGLSIQSLTLPYSCHFGDEGLRCMLLQHCQTLKTLDVSYCYALTLSGLGDIFKRVRRVNKFCALERLSMRGFSHYTSTHAYKDVMYSVADVCPNLTYVDVSCSGDLPATFFQAVAKARVKTLIAQGCSIQPTALTRSADLLQNCVEHLDLSNTKGVQDVLLAYLGFDLVSGNGVSCAGELPLKSLTMHNCTGCLNGVISALARACPNLECLDMSGCKSDMHTAFESLGQSCPKLKSLHCKNIILKDKCVQHLAKGCPLLSNVTWGVTNTTDAALKALGKYCKKMESFECMQYRGQYTDDGWYAFALGCKNIKRLRCNSKHVTMNFKLRHDSPVSDLYPKPLTDRTLYAFSSLVHMEELDISAVSNIFTAKALCHFFKYAEKLQKLNVMDTLGFAVLKDKRVSRYLDDVKKRWRRQWKENNRVQNAFYLHECRKQQYLHYV